MASFFEDDARDPKVRGVQPVDHLLSRSGEKAVRLQVLPEARPGGELVLPGFGFHDVVIETPDHGVNLSDLSAEEIGDVLLDCRDRITQLAKIKSIRFS